MKNLKYGCKVIAENKVNKSSLIESPVHCFFSMGCLIILICMALCVSSSSAQRVVQKGDTFVQVRESSDGKETMTQYTYTDSKGNVYPVYLSRAGKAYIKRVSKKSGREYKSYMPEIGKKINPKAYKNDKP